MDTRIRLTDGMLTGANGASLVAVFQNYAPENIELIRLELVHNEVAFELRVHLFFKRKGEREERSVSVPAGRYSDSSTYLDHRLLLSKLALVG